MTTREEITSAKMRFLEAIETPGYKLIAAAQALRVLYRAQSPAERQNLINWVRLSSDLDTFVSGEDTTYYISIAVLKKGLRRAQLAHLERYSSDETGEIETMHEDRDEYTFNIWRSQWSYVEKFLTQFEIGYRLLDSSQIR